MRGHGIESAEKTISAAHYRSALQTTTDNPSGLPQAAIHLPLHKGGIGTALVGSFGNIVGATIGRPPFAVEAIRLGIVQIHFLRQLGYENAEETAKS